MARIIVASTPNPGHATPLRRIAVDLASRGHDVVFLSGSGYAEAVAGTGVRFVALPGIADHSRERLAEIDAGRADVPEGPAMLNYEFIKAFYEPIPDQHAALQRILAEAPDASSAVVLVTDQSFMGLWPVLLGAPGLRPHAWIAIGVTPLSINSVDTAPFGLGLPPDASPEGRARNLEQNRMVEGMFAESTGVLGKTLAELGAVDEPPFPMDAIVSLPDLFLHLTVTEAEYPRSDAPAGLRYIGVLPAESAPSEELPSEELPTWWDDVLNARRVILVTQGTIANRDLGQLVAPTLKALADLDALVVVTTGYSEAAVGEIPANARVADFIPYSALLPHLDAVVTNGGYGGCLLALASGVPLVVAGRTEDKIEVSARLAWTGAAINLETSTPEPQAVRDAVNAVLDGDGETYRRNAQRLAAAMAEHRPFDAIAAAVQELTPAAD